MTPDTQTKVGKVTLVALVENKPGVLNRVASLFRRRAFNMDSLTVGRTHKAHISRMTIVVDEEPGQNVAHRIATNLYKLVNVIDVQVLNEERPHVSRDLALVKVKAHDAHSRNQLTTLCERYPARIIDIGPEVAIVEMVGTEDHVAEFIEAVRPLGIVELVRSGMVAMGRGTRIQDTEYQPFVPIKPNGVNGNGAHG